MLAAIDANARPQRSVWRGGECGGLPRPDLGDVLMWCSCVADILCPTPAGPAGGEWHLCIVVIGMENYTTPQIVEIELLNFAVGRPTKRVDPSVKI